MEDNKPIYDDKVKVIIRGLTEGKSREELAEQLKYTTYKSLDIYMRRKNFRYNSDNQMYEPLVEEKKDTHIPSSSRVMEIISLLSKEDNDPKSVAKRLGFKSHIEMADYLKVKGYVYDSEQNNYVKRTGKIDDEIEENLIDNDNNNYKDNEVSLSKSLTKNGRQSIPRSEGNSESLEEYFPVLDILLKNKEKLIDLLTPQLDTGNIPRYSIGGTFVTKSVHMSSNLDAIIRDFSREKGINQRGIFEVALIEFFKKYGYEAEAETLIS